MGLKKLGIVALASAATMLIVTGTLNKSHNWLSDGNNREIIEAIKNLGEIQKNFLDTLATPCTLIFAGIAVGQGIKEYQKTQEWKVREYLDTKFKEFEAKPETINVRKMLDDEERFVELFASEEKPHNRFVFVTDDMLKKALDEREERKTERKKELEEARLNFDGKIRGNDNYPRKKQKAFVEAAIRNSFDRFLDYLQQFDVMIESDVVKEEDLKNYLEPWFEIINNSNSTYRKELFKYVGFNIEKEHLTSVQKSVISLFNRYNMLDKNKV